MRARLILASIAVLIFLTGPVFTQPAPSPAARQSDIDKRVDALVGKMTLEEKVDLLGGVDGFFTRDVPRLNIPRLKMADGPLGVRNFGPATAMAAGISLAATWNPELAEKVGGAIGRDARAKGVHFLLGPGVNIYRAPMNGRNFEYYGEDPFLASRIAVGYINGVQAQGVSATIKHYMGNNSEFDRHNTDSVIDERTLREIYLPVFEAAVREAHVGAIMDSYNLTNGEHMTQSGYLNTDVAKKEWGFDGVIMSDWVATYDAVAAANGGLDLEMPSGRFLNRANLLPAVEQGKVTVATIDDKVRRLLRTAARFGWLDRDQTDLSIPRYNEQSREVALEAAIEGMVLLKNDGNLLPLKRQPAPTIAVIGPGAYPAVPVGGGSAAVKPFAAVSFLEGLNNYLGEGSRVLYARGIPTLVEMAEQSRFSVAETGGGAGLRAEYFTNPDLQGAPSVSRTESGVNVGGQQPAWPADARSARWIGYYAPATAGPQEVFVQTSGERGPTFRLVIDDKVVLEKTTGMNTALAYTTTLTLDARPHKLLLEERDSAPGGGRRLRLGLLPRAAIVEADAKAIAAKADVVVIAAGFDPETESEGADRTFQLPPGQDELIRQVGAANKNTIVVITSGGGVDMTPWLPNVRAVVEAWYPGQEGGRALPRLLFGDADFSGRLPATFERRWEDNPVHDSYYPEAGTKRIVYKEGVLVGYRGYEHAGTTPLFPFGFGLSYTTFKYANLAIRPAGSGQEVAFDVTNAGARAGTDVPQVYVGTPRELKGFAKVKLQPGETRRVTVTLGPRAFSHYDAAAKQWKTQPGTVDVAVGRSSQHIELRAQVAVK